MDKFPNKPKKALSTVIATMILILLSLTAVGILGVTIKNLADRVQMSPEINCFEIKTQPPMKIQSACYSTQNNEIEITLKRDLQDTKINELTFTAQNSEWCCGTNCPACTILNIAEAKTYYLNTAEKPEKISLNIGECLVETQNVGDC